MSAPGRRKTGNSSQLVLQQHIQIDNSILRRENEVKFCLISAVEYLLGGIILGDPKTEVTMRFSFLLVVCVTLVTTVGIIADDRSPRLNPSIESDMLFDGEKFKASSEPNGVRIYWKGEDAKVNRSRQPRDLGYPKFPKSDVRLEDREEAQFHLGRDFPTAKPTAFRAGVHGTVIYAGPPKWNPESKEKIVLVMMPTGEVMHYLHASEVEVKFGDEVTPFTFLGKTSNHLHLQSTDKDGKLIDVDRSFLAGRSPIPGSTIKAFQPKWIDVGPQFIGKKKPVVEDGILKVDKSMKVYYDDDAPKGEKDDDPIQSNSRWKGELTQRGKHPEVKELPPKFEAVMVITERKDDSFEAELHETAGRASVTYLCKGKVTKAKDGTSQLDFESLGAKDLSKGFIISTKVPFSAKTNADGTEIKGKWKYPKNDKGVELEGEFHLIRQKR